MTGEKLNLLENRLLNNYDNLLTTPMHDKLVIDLLDKDYCNRVIPFLKDNHKLTDIIDYGSLVKRPPFNTIYRGGIIAPLSDSQKWCTGFVSIVNEVYMKGIFDISSIESEVPLITKKSIIGYFDIVISYDIKSGIQYFNRKCGNPKCLMELYNAIGRDFKSCSHGTLIDDKFKLSGKIYIEVKPRTDSFGATLRQLKKYMFYMGENPIIYIYTPDVTFDKEFKSQGINVIHPL